MSWTPRCLGDFLAGNARTRPDAEALVTDTTRLTQAQLYAEAHATARALRALGIRKGEHIGLLIPNTEHWVILFYAASLIGAVTVPINTRFKPAEIAFALKQADCVAVFAVDRFLNIDVATSLMEAGAFTDALPLLRHMVIIGDTMPPRAESWTQFRARDPGGPDVTCDQRDTDPLLIQFTSGTTAYPKGVLLTHHAMLRDAAAVALRLGVRPEDRYLNCRPFFHVAGSTLSLLVCLVTGATMVTPPTFSAEAALRMLDRERCTLTSGNDSIFQLMLSHPDFDRSKIHLRAGWAAAGPETMRKIVEEMGVTGLCWAYGLSEAAPNIVFSDHREPVEQRIAGLALPHPGLDIRIADPETNAPLPPETRGEVQARGWNIMLGYHNNPEATAKTFTDDGWLRTGDLGSLSPEGYLRLSGRLKDVIRVGGENVAPAEVEETLLSHPAIAMAQVVGIPDPRLGEVPVAFLRLRDGATTTAEEILAWARPRLANFRLPRNIWLVADFEAIGMTASGKVQKTKLREVALSLIPSSGP